MQHMYLLFVVFAIIIVYVIVNKYKKETPISKLEGQGADKFSVEQQKVLQVKQWEDILTEYCKDEYIRFLEIQEKKYLVEQQLMYIQQLFPHLMRIQKILNKSGQQFKYSTINKLFQEYLLFQNKILKDKNNTPIFMQNIYKKIDNDMKTLYDQHIKNCKIPEDNKLSIFMYMHDNIITKDIHDFILRSKYTKYPESDDIIQSLYKISKICLSESQKYNEQTVQQQIQSYFVGNRDYLQLPKDQITREALKQKHPHNLTKSWKQFQILFKPIHSICSRLNITGYNKEDEEYQQQQPVQPQFPYWQPDQLEPSYQSKKKKKLHWLQFSLDNFEEKKIFMKLLWLQKNFKNQMHQLRKSVFTFNMIGLVKSDENDLYQGLVFLDDTLFDGDKINYWQESSFLNGPTFNVIKPRQMAIQQTTPVLLFDNFKQPDVNLQYDFTGYVNFYYDNDDTPVFLKYDFTCKFNYQQFLYYLKSFENPGDFLFLQQIVYSIQERFRFASSLLTIPPRFDQILKQTIEQKEQKRRQQALLQGTVYVKLVYSPYNNDIKYQFVDEFRKLQYDLYHNEYDYEYSEQQDSNQKILRNSKVNFELVKKDNHYLLKNSDYSQNMFQSLWDRQYFANCFEQTQIFVHFYSQLVSETINNKYPNLTPAQKLQKEIEQTKLQQQKIIDNIIIITTPKKYDHYYALMMLNNQLYVVDPWAGKFEKTTLNDTLHYRILDAEDQPNEQLRKYPLIDDKISHLDLIKQTGINIIFWTTIRCFSRTMELSQLTQSLYQQFVNNQMVPRIEIEKYTIGIQDVYIPSIYFVFAQYMLQQNNLLIDICRQINDNQVLIDPTNNDDRIQSHLIQNVQQFLIPR